MDPTITALGLTLGSAGLVYLADRFLARWRERLEREGYYPSFSAKIAKLTAELTRASSEVQDALVTLRFVTEERGKALQALESELARLAEQETQAKGRVQALEKVPLAAVEHFLAATERADRRARRRAYLLFGGRCPGDNSCQSSPQAGIPPLELRHLTARCG